MSGSPPPLPIIAWLRNYERADLGPDIIAGLTTAVMPFNLMMVVVGCFAGTFIGDRKSVV